MSGETQALRPIVVVTGGSDGIGLELAKRFADGGQEVLLIARGGERLAKAGATITRSSTLSLDVRADDACARIDAHLTSIGGYCDILINSAGIGHAGEFIVQDQEVVTRLCDLNVRALTTLTRHYLPAMLERRRGGIMNVASLGGFTPGPWQATYYASKAYVISFTEAIAYESAGKGVQISVLCPGPIETEFHRRMGGETGLYMHVLPVGTPQFVARKGFLRFQQGRTVITPGLVNSILVYLMGVAPHGILVPIISWLLRVRK